MSRAKLFLENFFVYGLAGTIGKAVPVIMVPIITRLIPDTSIYGTYDLLRVLVSFASAFAILGMYDAMFRIYFDSGSKEHKVETCSSAYVVVLISSIIIGVLVIVLSKQFSLLLFTEKEYWPWVCLIGIQIIVSSISRIVRAPTRMQNKRKVFVIMNFVAPLVGYGTAIPIIILVNPLLGLVLSGFSSALVTLLIFGYLNKKWFKFIYFKKDKAKEMLKIGLPLVPTFLIYWIFSSFDRIMISNMLGVEQNGIYAIGAKVGALSQLVYTAFAGGWQYFNFSTMKDKDHGGIISIIYEYIGALSLTFFTLLVPWFKMGFSLLFEGNYINGFVVAPYLFLSPLLLMLFQNAASQFIVIKKSYWTTICLVLGALVNIVLNFYLIPILGIKGAAIATLIGYITSVVIGTLIASRKKLIKIRKKFVIVAVICGVFFFFSEVYVKLELKIEVLFSLLVIIVIYLLYYKEIKTIKNRFFK